MLKAIKNLLFSKECYFFLYHSLISNPCLLHTRSQHTFSFGNNRRTLIYFQNMKIWYPQCQTSRFIIIRQHERNYSN